MRKALRLTARQQAHVLKDGQTCPKTQKRPCGEFLTRPGFLCPPVGTAWLWPCAIWFGVVNCRFFCPLFYLYSLKNSRKIFRAKYPLAIIDRLINLLGNDLLIGYDIGCGFSTTADNSSKLGPKIQTSKLRFCVNAFHGHAHNRSCQLSWHPLYRSGTGLEDFEGCERVFSDSNRVAICTRHSSKFHRRQALVRHFERWNRDKYAELSESLFTQPIFNLMTL